jgi:hypothetical protein
MRVACQLTWYRIGKLSQRHAALSRQLNTQQKIARCIAGSCQLCLAILQEGFGDYPAGKKDYDHRAPRMLKTM